MVESCCAVNCTSRRTKGTNVRFYCFPGDGIATKARRAKWIAAVNRVGWLPNKYSRICSEHFISKRPSRDPHDLDYVPSVFSFKRKVPDMSAVRRYQRAKNRRIQRLNAEADQRRGSGDSHVLGHNDGPNANQVAHSLHLASSTPAISTDQRTQSAFLVESKPTGCETELCKHLEDTESDSSYCLSPTMFSVSTQTEISSFEANDRPTAQNESEPIAFNSHLHPFQVTSVTYEVDESCLLLLFRFCFQCHKEAQSSVHEKCGTSVVIRAECPDGHSVVWNSKSAWEQNWSQDDAETPTVTAKQDIFDDYNNEHSYSIRPPLPSTQAQSSSDLPTLSSAHTGMDEQLLYPPVCVKQEPMVEPYYMIFEDSFEAANADLEQDANVPPETEEDTAPDPFIDCPSGLLEKASKAKESSSQIPTFSSDHSGMDEQLLYPLVRVKQEPMVEPYDMVVEDASEAYDTDLETAQHDTETQPEPVEISRANSSYHPTTVDLNASSDTQKNPRIGNLTKHCNVHKEFPPVLSGLSSIQTHKRNKLLQAYSFLHKFVNGEDEFQQQKRVTANNRMVKLYPELLAVTTEDGGLDQNCKRSVLYCKVCIRSIDPNDIRRLARNVGLHFNSSLHQKNMKLEEEKKNSTVLLNDLTPNSNGNASKGNPDSTIFRNRAVPKVLKDSSVKMIFSLSSLVANDQQDQKQ